MDQTLHYMKKHSNKDVNSLILEYLKDFNYRLKEEAMRRQLLNYFFVAEPTYRHRYLCAFVSDEDLPLGFNDLYTDTIRDQEMREYYYTICKLDIPEKIPTKYLTNYYISPGDENYKMVIGDYDGEYYTTTCIPPFYLVSYGHMLRFPILYQDFMDSNDEISESDVLGEFLS